MKFTTDHGVGRSAPSRVASLHATGGGWSLVIASTETGSPKILAAERLSEGDGVGVRRLMATHRAERLVRVIPTGEAILRSVSLPVGDQGAMHAAIDLMAEAQLPSSIEPHRRGAGLLPLPGTDDTQRTGLIAGWHGTEAPEQVLADEDDESWAPAGAGLAHLIALAKGRDWTSDPAWAVASDARDSTCAIVASHEGTRLRAGRIGSAQSVIAEMHAGASVAGGRHVAMDGRTLEALKSVAPTSGIDGAWADHHAVAAGVALGALTTDRGLFAMLPEPPKYHYTLPQRAALWLTNHRNVRAGIALGLLLIFVAPVALVYARHATLEVKLDRAREALGADAQAEVDTLVRNAAFARQLLDKRIPYSKYLAAISDALPIGDTENPLGVQIERIDISADRISLRGEASSREIVLVNFAQNLKNTGLFDSVRPEAKDEAGTDRASFTLTAQVGNTEQRLALKNDFGTETYAVRLHGETARDFDYASLETVGGDAGNGGASSSRPGRAGSTPRRASFDSGGGETADADPIPEVLGSDKISEMNFTDARAAFAERRRAASRSDIDEDTKRLLAEDVDLLRAHLRTVDRD